METVYKFFDEVRRTLYRNENGTKGLVDFHVSVSKYKRNTSPDRIVFGIRKLLRFESFLLDSFYKIHHI